ncbi:hypothetical protein [Leifsonia sp. NPDC058248]|uniref:hypothetical protein n=1 Tax=Leifsonia sp. NPDC058248 TaxID=3346402 RepID=UPI0036DEE790
MSDEACKAADETAEYLSRAREMVDEFANDYPEVTVYPCTMTFVAYTEEPAVAFLIWIREFTHGAAALELNPTGTAEEMRADLIRSMHAARVGLKNLWFDTHEDDNARLQAKVFAVADELTVALNSAHYGAPSGTLTLTEGADQHIAELTISIFVADESYDIEESVDLRASAADAVAELIGRLDERRQRLVEAAAQSSSSDPSTPA